MQHDRSVVLLVFSGLPGTGKSTVASEVVARRPAVLLSVDPIESAMARAGIAPSFERATFTRQLRERGVSGGCRCSA